MRFGTWNVRSLYRSGSIMTVARELSSYKLDLVGVQEVRWDKIKGSIKISAKESLGLYERKLHKQWFDEECSKFLDQRKQAKMQWLQNPNQSNVDNLKNVRREASRHLRNKKKEYLKAKINEHETNSKNKNIRDLYRASVNLRRVTSPEIMF
jgi:hypothetical protein